MAKTIYFAQRRAPSGTPNLVRKTAMLFEKAGFARLVKKRGDLVAVKLHFGEPGNTTFLRPPFVRVIVDCIKEAGGKPFLTDTNTLYRGHRGNSVDHLAVAHEHGFSYGAMGCPVIIADGLYGRNFVETPVGLKHYQRVRMAGDLYHADACIVLSHFKGHCAMGFGGALKNVGMGMANRGGKQSIHSQVYPSVDQRKCTACGTCVQWCPAAALTVVKRAAHVNTRKCIGCGECTAACPTGAIGVRWEDPQRKEQERLVEFCYGVMQQKAGRIAFMNFLLDITPDCDCFGQSDAPIVPDIGLLASWDPVAIDQASLDLVNAQPGFADSALQSGHAAGGDKFRGVTPDVNHEIQLQYAEQIGVGERKYRLARIDAG